MTYSKGFEMTVVMYIYTEVSMLRLADIKITLAQFVELR